MSDLINLFRTLVKIPSPSMREDAVAEKIMSFFTENGIDCRRIIDEKTAFSAVKSR